MIVDRATVEARRAEHGLPGCSVAALGPDGRVGSAACGSGSLGRAGRPLGEASRFRVGSLTKLATALAVLDLRDAGRLSLDEPVWRWLPAPAGRPPITLRHLLSHRAGLIRGAYRADAGESGEPRARCVFAPGAKFKYSNLGFELAAAVVERASGQPFVDYVRRRVLGAAGASGADFDERPGGRATAGADFDGGGERVVETTGYQRAQYREIVVPGDPLCPAPAYQMGLGSTGLRCSPADYCRLLAAAAGRFRLHLERPAAGADQAGGWGLGVARARLFGEDCLCLTGGHFGYTSYALWLPGRGLGGVATANRGSALPALIPLLHDLLAGAWAGYAGRPAPRPAPDFGRYAGAYRGPSTSLRFRADAGELWLDAGGDAPARLQRVGPHAFACLQGAFARRVFRFHAGEAGGPGVSAGDEFFHPAGGATPTRESGPRASASSAAAPPWGWGYGGTYRSPVTGEAKLFVRAGRPFVEYSALEEAALVPTGEGVFRQEGGPFDGEPLKVLAAPSGEPFAFRSGGMRFARS